MFNGQSGDVAGYSIDLAGDVNGDGFSDLLISSPNVDAGGNVDSGRVYLQFGGVTNLMGSDVNADGVIETTSLGNGTNSYVINGAAANDRLGFGVTGLDINGDGVSDIVVGSRYADPAGNTDAGETYVIFGGADIGLFDGTDGTTDGTLHVSGLAGGGGTYGYVIRGAASSTYSGSPSLLSLTKLSSQSRSS